MTLSLVSITHATDPDAEIPFIGHRGSLVRVSVETRLARTIASMGFDVEVHEEPYDPLAVQAKRAAALAETLAGVARPEPVIAEEPVVAPTAIAPVAEEPVVAPTAIAPVVEEPAAALTVAETATPDDEPGMSDEEIAALKDRISELDTLTKAKALIEEFQISLDPSITKLKDIKVALLAMMESE